MIHKTPLDQLKHIAKTGELAADEMGLSYSVTDILAASGSNPFSMAILHLVNDVSNAFTHGTLNIKAGLDQPAEKAASPTVDTVCCLIEGTALALAQVLAPMQNDKLRKKMRAHFLKVWDEAQSIWDLEYDQFKADRNKRIDLCLSKKARPKKP